MPWEEPYVPEDDETPYLRDIDPVSEAVGATGFVSRYMLADCREVAGSLAKYPETFDRYYWEPERLLVDILVGDSGAIPLQANRKNVEFKRRWCAENGWRYLVLTEDEAADSARVKARLSELGGPTEPAPAVPKRRGRPPKSERGGVQRPKAAA